jgi:predicted amidohydrolase
MKIAVLQTVSPAGDRDAALGALRPALAAAGAAGTAVLVTPETFLPGYNVEDPGAAALTRAQATALAGPLCRAAGCGLVLGYAERDGDRVFNAALALDAEGRDLANYRKIQLYGPREQALYAPGEAYAVFELQGVRAGLLICYDVEVFAHVAELRRRGVRLLLAPTANMRPFTHVSRATVPAHAANGEMTIAYANYCGTEGDLAYAGGSVVAGPHGEVVAQAGETPALLIADVPDPDPARSFDPVGDFRPGR